MHDRENRAVDAFRAEFNQNRADLAAFEEAYSAEQFSDKEEVFAWCKAWWEERLQGRALDHGERRLRGAQGKN